MKKYAMLIASLHLLFYSQLLAFDEDFWINTTESVQRDLRYVANIAANDGTIFAATGSGLWRSDNAGDSWEHVPISDFGIVAGVSVLNDGTILVGGRDSLHMSADLGENWKTISHVEQGIPQIDYYRFVERADGTWFVAMRDWYSGQFVADGIWQSIDKGQSWTLVCDNFANGAKSTCIALHPNGDVFWGSWEWEGLFVLRAETGECHNIYAPGGKGEQSWDPLTMGINSRGDIMVGTETRSVAVWTSTDTGKSWTAYDHWQGHNPKGDIRTITRDRFDNFVVSARDTVWYTDDLAQTWTRLPGYLEKFEIIHSLCLDSSDYLYVGTDQGRIYRSREPIYTTTGINTSEPNNSTFNFSLSPNPTTGDLTIDFTLETQGLVTAELFDMRGNRLGYFAQKNADSGHTTMKLPCGNVPSGVYILRCMSGSQLLHRFVTILR